MQDWNAATLLITVGLFKKFQIFLKNIYSMGEETCLKVIEYMILGLLWNYEGHNNIYQIHERNFYSCINCKFLAYLACIMLPFMIRIY